MKMYEHFLTIGLFDRKTLKQEIETEAAKQIISDILINQFEVTAFTMIECFGVYKMNTTGEVVREPSIRVEIADSESKLTQKTVRDIVTALRRALKQESVMHKVTISEIEFIEEA